MSKAALPSYPRYRPRRLTFLGVESVSDYRLKVYSICPDAQPFGRERFAGALGLAGAVLPEPNPAAGRPGVGLVILHQGLTADNLVLCWWDDQIALPTRIFVRGPLGWRAAEGGESFCVWDLRVMWSEREAYVSTVLAGRPDGVESYLAVFVEGYA